MSITILMTDTNHIFTKCNNVTLKNKHGYYDALECSCGLKVKRYGFGEEVEVDGRTSYKKRYNCPKNGDVEKIKIIKCDAVGDKFANLKPGSIHEVIKSKTSPIGYWVMGSVEPVVVLFNECEKCKEE